MANSEKTTSSRQPLSFSDNISHAKLVDKVARRTARRFSTKTLRAALFPQHMGTMDQPDGYARTAGSCGDLITFYLRIQERRIPEITFTTDGCDVTIASGETLASMVTGLSLKEAAQVTSNDLLTALDGLPPNHTHCAELAVSTLRGAIASYQGSGNS